MELYINCASQSLLQIATQSSFMSRPQTERTQIENLLVLSILLAIAPFYARSIQLIIAPLFQFSARAILLSISATAQSAACSIPVNFSDKTTIDPCAFDTIDLSVDVNQDGISDLLLIAAQQHLDFQNETMKRYQASANSLGSNTQDFNDVIQAAGREFRARKPYSVEVHQLMDEVDRAIDSLHKNSDPIASKVLQTRMSQIDKKIARDPSYIKVEEAEKKVYQEIRRRKSAEWLFSTPS
jgi:hypothetical protein